MGEYDVRDTHTCAKTLSRSTKANRIVDFSAIWTNRETGGDNEAMVIQKSMHELPRRRIRVLVRL